MKHIFLIHSHTLFLTALGTIEFLNLNEDDIIFVYSRNYRTIIETSYLCIDMSDDCENCFHAILSFSHRNYLINYRLKRDIINKVDAFIDSYARGGFCLYIPHLQNLFCQIFATNKKCIECNFIQEGGRVMSKFLNGNDLFFFKLYNILFLRNEKRMWKTICWFPAQNTSIAQSIKVFAIDRCFFCNNPNNYNIIKWPIFELSYKLETKWPIFVYEGAVELGLIEYHYYIDAVKEQIERYSQEKNYIKFHPMQSNKERKHIENLFIEENKEVVVLPMDIPFELFITSNKDLNIYGFGSSLLFFSKTYGHNVISDEKNLLISNKYKWYYSKVSLKK